VVHVTSSLRSRGCEAKVGRFDGIGCGGVEVGPSYHSLAVIFLLAHRGILVFSFLINRTQGLVERQAFNHPSPTPFALGFHFGWCGCALCHREERRKVIDLPNLLKTGRMFGWFSYLVNT
jgi:hypothetical protein